MTLSGAASPFAGRKEERNIIEDVGEGAFLQGGLEGRALFRDFTRVIFCSLKTSRGNLCALPKVPKKYPRKLPRFFRRGDSMLPPEIHIKY